MADNKAIKAHASCDHERALYVGTHEVIYMVQCRSICKEALSD